MGFVAIKDGRSILTNSSAQIIRPLGNDEVLKWAENTIKFVYEHPWYERQPDTQMMVLNNDGERIAFQD